MSERGDIRASVSGRYGGESLQVGKRRAILSALVGHGMHRECNENRSRECREQHSELDYCRVRLSLTRRVTSKVGESVSSSFIYTACLATCVMSYGQKSGAQGRAGNPGK